MKKNLSIKRLRLMKLDIRKKQIKLSAGTDTSGQHLTNNQFAVILAANKDSGYYFPESSVWRRQLTRWLWHRQRDIDTTQVASPVSQTT